MTIPPPTSTWKLLCRRICHVLLLIAGLAAIGGLAVQPASAQTLLREVHFDAASDTITDPVAGYHLLTENGFSYNVPYLGVWTLPWFSGSVAKDGTRSLGITVGPSATGQTENDRTEFTIEHQGDSLGLQLGQDRYLGFAIYFNSGNFPAPVGEIIVSQIWQSYTTVVTGPPAFLTMLPGATDLSFKLATRDDSSQNSSTVPLTNTKFVRGQWNSVVLHVLPRALGDPAGLGTIEMWLNGNYLGGATRTWGYAVSTSINAFDVRVGMYANPGAVAHTVWIDSVRWGTTRAAVDPGVGSVSPYVPTPTVSLTATTPNAAEINQVPGVFTLTLDAASTAPTTVPIVLTGTATAGVDYTGNPAITGGQTTVTIPAGATSATFEVTPLVKSNSTAGAETVIATLVPSPAYLTASAASVATVTISGPLPYTIAWENAYAALGFSGTAAGLLADPDGDGIPNLLEFAFNLNPLAADPPAGMPVLGSATFNDSSGVARHFPTLTFTQRTDTSRLTYTVEASIAPASGWSASTSVFVSAVPSTVNPNVETVVYRSSFPMDGPNAAPQQFLRVRVTSQ